MKMFIMGDKKIEERPPFKEPARQTVVEALKDSLPSIAMITGAITAGIATAGVMANGGIQLNVGDSLMLWGKLAAFGATAKSLQLLLKADEDLTVLHPLSASSIKDKKSQTPPPESGPSLKL